MQIDLLTLSSALLGGILIGLAAVLLLIGLGRVAGVSGIAFELLSRQGWSPPNLWRAGFLIGLLAAGWVWTQWTGQSLQPNRTINVWMLAASGLLVGFGTAQSSGCTSGHGVCGLGRLSVRSFAAVITFMLTAALTVFVLRHTLS